MRLAATTASAATHWDAILAHNNGWTGADGIFSIPYSGNDSPGSASLSPTGFVFSDTFVGTVVNNVRQGGWTMVHNTLAKLTGNLPDASKMQFYVAHDPATGKTISMFSPTTPGTQSGDWYWLGDGIA